MLKNIFFSLKKEKVATLTPNTSIMQERNSHDIACSEENRSLLFTEKWLQIA
jgi:hypothetical protein